MGERIVATGIMERKIWAASFAVAHERIWLLKDRLTPILVSGIERMGAQADDAVQCYRRHLKRIEEK